MSQKPKDHTKHTSTTEFEVDGIEEAYAPAPGVQPGKPYRPPQGKKLEVETPPELQEPTEHTAKIWILERRAIGWLARVRRWMIGQTRK